MPISMRCPRARRATSSAVLWSCRRGLPFSSRSPRPVSADRGQKLDTYASWTVGHAWLVDPDAFNLEAYRLEGARWVRLGVWTDEARVRVEPFEAFELALDVLWSR